MKNVILLVGAFMFALPLLVGAQTGSPSMTIACPALPTVGSCPEGQVRVVTYSSPECGTYYGCTAGKTDARTSCAMPINPTSASDWTTTITCILSRISDIENRLVALEKARTDVITSPTRSDCKKTGEDMWLCFSEDQAKKIEVTTEGVRAIQTVLKVEGSFDYPVATGYYGSYTKEAVYEFQKKNGLVSSGIIDQPTLEKLEVLAPQIAPSMTQIIKNIE